MSGPFLFESQNRGTVLSIGIRQATSLYVGNFQLFSESMFHGEEGKPEGAGTKLKRRWG